MTESQILATGAGMIGGGIRGTGSAIRELIEEAESEIHILAYAMTEEAIPIIRLLESGLERGLGIALVINRLDGQDRRIAAMLRSMNRRHGGFTLGSFEDPGGWDLHAKVLVQDRRTAVIGSANISWRGMEKNIEIGVLVRDGSAWRLSSVIDDLAARTRVAG